MANIGFATSNNIIRDLFDTPQEAINASKELGCDGFRSYTINGQIKYVPCSSFVQYERALRYREVRGKIGAFANDTFGNKLVGFQFANAKDEIQGDPFFTLGNFSIQKSVQQTPRQIELQSTSLQLDTTPLYFFKNVFFEEIVEQNTEPILLDSSKRFTVENIGERNLQLFQGKDFVKTLQERVNSSLNVNVLFDKRKLDNYVLYSSLKDRFKNVVIEIFNNYPAAIKINPISVRLPSISDYVSYPLEARSEFKVNIFGLSNPFLIEYAVSGTTLEDSETVTKYRNFSKTFTDYVVHYNGVDYPIINTELPLNREDTTNGIKLIVDGDPFSEIVDLNNTANVLYYIKPKNKVYQDFYNNLSDLASFLLNKNENTGEFTSEFVYPSITDDGTLITLKEVLSFPVLDEFNIDMFGSDFDIYTTTLNNLADSYDGIKTNLISRYLTTESLQEFDTDDRKMNMLLQLFGNNFDNIRKYIDGIAFMRNVSYDKIENVPDLLIKNYARMLGLKTFEVEDEDTLINSLFDLEGEDLEPGTTPAEIDIEIWRRILINSAYLYKSKGTRKSIEFILKLVGLPEEIFEINEYVYLADNTINVIDVLNKIYNTSVTQSSPFNDDISFSVDDPDILIENLPFNSEGFPTVPLNIRFQENGGSIREDKNNVGVFDFGQEYVNAYRKFDNTFLFDVYRTLDNVKSWVFTDKVNQYIKNDKTNYTEYEAKHSDLVINSKELEVYLSLNRVFDLPIYRQYVRNIGVVNADLNINRKFNANELTFNQFMKKALDVFINPLNRKTIKTYPTLSKIYFDYIKTTNTPIDYMRSLEFINKFDSSWVRLVEQFVPATSIVNAGKKIQNSSLMDNKFIYKHGLNNDVNWLGTDGSEFQQKTLKPVYLGSTDITDNVGKITRPIIGESPTYSIKGVLGQKISGVDPTINEYFGSYYSMFEYCQDDAFGFYIWEPEINYGDDTLFFGNINNQPDDRLGVFVIYEEKLYRLRTNFGLTGTTISTAGTGATTNTKLPPNKATIEYNGNDIQLWELIPLDAVASTITFSDSDGSNITNSERSYYIKSISMGLSFLNIGIDFDCPPPKPHVCYYDFLGKDIIVDNTTITFLDENGDEQRIKQPKFYGYSKDYSDSKPLGLAYGTISNWTTNYKKRFKVTSTGKTFYLGEIIANIDSINNEKLVPSSNVYIVTGDTYTTTGSTHPSSVELGLALIGVADVGGNIDTSTITGNTKTVGGLYEGYFERTKTDPFMHVDPAYINKIRLNPNVNTHSINLTKSLNLSHIFSGATAEQTYKVSDNIVDNELFISDPISLRFDGFYQLDPLKSGPFYTLNEETNLIHTLNDRLLLLPNVDNYISIQSLNDNFTIIGEDVSLVDTNPGHYLVTKSNFIEFNFNLYFESEQNTNQTVIIELVNAIGFVFTNDSFTFNGDDNPNLREYNFIYNGFFTSGDKVFLRIRPIDLPCTISRYEEIEYEHVDLDISEYNPLNDPRFRLLHYSGFSGVNEYLDGHSIKPIYNQSDLTVNNLQIRSSLQRYINIPILDIQYSTNPDFIHNKLFLSYFEKNRQNEIIYDTVVYDKQLNYDKIDFSFKIRSKNDTFVSSGVADTSTNINKRIGVQSATVEYEVDFTDYYLGNSINQTDYNDVSNAIKIGKNIGLRKTKYNRAINLSPKFSFYNDIQLGTNENTTTKSFVSLDGGIEDYTKFDLSNNLIREIKERKRYNEGLLGTESYTLYRLENDIYEGEIYKKLLDLAPEFNPEIVNYELNDIVKIPIDDYIFISEVNEISANEIIVGTGERVLRKSVFRLYVCINDITEKHCYTLDDGGNDVQGEIHEIYHPRGSRSCFIEIEKYNPSNFTPWGYEHSPLQTTINPNNYDYINRDPIIHNISNEYKFGDIVIGEYDSQDEYFRFIYQKPLSYQSDRNYYKGDFVYSGNTFYIAKKDSKGVALGDTSSWSLIDNTNDDLFNHQSLIGTKVDSVGGSWLSTLNNFTVFATTASRLPKLLPVTSGGTPVISVNDARWANVLINGNCFIDDANTFFSPPSRAYDVSVVRKMLRGNFDPGVYYGSDMYNPNNLPYEIYDENKNYDKGKVILSNTYSLTGDTQPPYIKISSNSTSGNTVPIIGEDWGVYPLGFLITNSYFETDDYIDKFGISRLGKTNIKLRPAVPFFTPDKKSVYTIPSFTENANVYPLFERLGRVSERNNPSLFNITGTTYNTTSDYLGYKYTVSRGVLYKYVNTTTNDTFNLEPYEDITNWIEKDFCLVNNFKFYKDRTKVQIFESKIDSLTDSLKDELFFFNKNLTLKNGVNGFTSKSYSGTTVDNRLIGALDKFYEITDKNRTTPTKSGITKFRSLGGDLILDYIPEKDELGFPITGEFMGKLQVSNPCGHLATTIFGVLFDTNINQLDRTKDFRQISNTPPETVDILPYVVRLVVRQDGESNATLNIKYVDVSLNEISDTISVTRGNVLDEKYNITPETYFEVQVSYTTERNQTNFGSAFIDTNELFINNQTIDTNTVKTTFTKNNFTEVRTIRLKNLRENRTIFINLSGINSVNVANLDINSINIDPNVI